MKKNTTDEILQRFEWLIEILAGERTPSTVEAEHLFDLRQFCKLEVKNRFNEISYNTLKKYCDSITLPANLQVADSPWSSILVLRARAYDETQLLTQLYPAEPPPDQIIAEMSHHIHLCESAYIALYTKIKNFVDHEIDLSATSRARLSGIATQSQAMYSKLFSTPLKVDPEQNLKVIQGGKK